jgi:hypothetical protein
MLLRMIEKKIMHAVLASLEGLNISGPGAGCE